MDALREGALASEVKRIKQEYIAVIETRYGEAAS